MVQTDQVTPQYDQIGRKCKHFSEPKMAIFIAVRVGQARMGLCDTRNQGKAPQGFRVGSGT